MKNILFIIPVLVFTMACHKKISDTKTVAHTEKVDDKTIEKSVEKPVEKQHKDSVFLIPNVVRNNKRLDIPNGVDSNLLISFQRTSCFGKCPVFKIEIFKDGIARYSGKAFTKRMNVHEAVVDDLTIQKIQKKAAEIKYFELQNTYPQGELQISDLPHIISYIRTENTGKLINNAYDAPKELIDFERWLENELDILDWKEVK